MFDALTRLSRTVSRIVAWAAGAGLLAMTGVVLWQVVARYVFNASPPWAEQWALVLLIAFVFFAGAAGVREGFHIRIEAIAKAAPAPIGRALAILASLVVFLCGAALAAFGTELVIATWSHDLPAIPISRGAAYLPAPLSGALIAFFAAEQAIATARGTLTEAAWR